MITVRETAQWGLPRRALHKVYRHLLESPRRKRIAGRVLSLPPSPYVDPGASFSVHMLICRRDVGMAICTAKVANLAFEAALPWVFHDDGSLLDEDEERIVRQLPGCTVVRRSDADRRADASLSTYPEIRTYRNHQVMALKLVDVKLWARGPRTSYIDSDILFFRKPEFILEAIHGDRSRNYFNRDIADGYVKPSERIEEEVGIRPHSRLNAGLWVMHTEDLNLDRIEAWLKHPAFRRNLYDYTLDQTFISMLAASSRSGVEYLPPTYDVDFHKNVASSVCKHYVGRIRHGYELEGLRHLLTTCRFSERWQPFVEKSSERAAVLGA